MAYDYANAAGLGADTIDRGVLGMPFINIIQKGSPEFDETHKKFAERQIEGCRPGNILFEPERAILPQPVTIIPLAQSTLYTEWKPNKGGFVGPRPLTIVSDPSYRRGTPGTPTEYREYLGQNEVVFTIYFLVLFEHNNEWKQGLIAFTSTQLKVGRNWGRTILNTRLPDQPNLQLPIYASAYKLGTFADGNAKGGYFSWTLERDRILDPQADEGLLVMAESFTRSAQQVLPQAPVVGALPVAREGVVEAELVEDGETAF